MSCLSVRPSDQRRSTPVRWTYTKLGKNNGQFMLRPVCICDYFILQLPWLPLLTKVTSVHGLLYLCKCTRKFCTLWALCILVWVFFFSECTAIFKPSTHTQWCIYSCLKWWENTVLGFAWLHSLEWEFPDVLVVPLSNGWVKLVFALWQLWKLAVDLFHDTCELIVLKDNWHVAHCGKWGKIRG